MKVGPHRGLVVVTGPERLVLVDGNTTMTKKTAKANTQAKATKADQIIKLLSRPNGTTIADIARATEWQLHSVRGFLAGRLRQKGITVTSNRDKGKDRSYRIAGGDIQ